MTIIGWDIGGVNTKAARLDRDPAPDPVFQTVCEPYELQYNPGALAPTLTRLAQQLGGGADTHAVTMTAELSQAFRSKREGVSFVLDAVEAAFPGDEVRVYTVEGRFVAPGEARTIPFSVGAANWMATASLVARTTPTCLLIDIGTTSTDIIPIVDGTVAAAGRTDPQRLLSGELVYTGALRTPAEALVPGLAAEGFALIGDAHVWLGQLSPDDYTVTPPDRRPATREFAGERLARLVCGDRELLDDATIDRLARALVDAQVQAVVEGIERVRARCPAVTTAVVTGLGEFIAAKAARRAGLEVLRLADQLGPAARIAPAAAVAWLLADELCRVRSEPDHPAGPSPSLAAPGRPSSGTGHPAAEPHRTPSTP